MFTTADEIIENYSDEIMNASVATIVWSSPMCDQMFMDGSNFSEYDLILENLRNRNEVFQQITKFISIADELGLLSRYLEAHQLYNNSGLDLLVHDFWLTSNGHGIGFWGRGLGDLGDSLSGVAGAFPEHYVYYEDHGDCVTWGAEFNG